MTRERFLDPEVCKSEQVARLKDPWAKLLWDRIIVTSDDEGRRKASGYSLKADCFPCDGIPIEHVERCRDALAEVGLIRLYEDGDGSPFLDIPPAKWTLYQKLRHVKQSRYPEFPGSGEIRPKPPEPAGNSQNPPKPAGTCREPAESVTGCGVEGCGEEGRGVDAVSSAARKGAAEENGEESPFAAKPIPAPALPAAEAPDGGADDFAETRGWLEIFDVETGTWPDNNNGAREEARRLIRLDYSAARMVLAHVWEVNQSRRAWEKKNPKAVKKRGARIDGWTTLGSRLTMCRVPGDRALRAAGNQLGGVLANDTS